MFFTLALRFSTSLKLLQRAFRSGSIAFSKINLVLKQCNMKSCKNVQSKTKKQIKYFQLLWKKSNFVSSRKQPRNPSDYKLPVSYKYYNKLPRIQVDQGLQWGNENHLGRFRYIDLYFGIFRHIQTLFIHIKNHDIFKIRNRGIFRTVSNI